MASAQTFGDLSPAEKAQQEAESNANLFLTVNRAKDAGFVGGYPTFSIDPSRCDYVKRGAVFLTEAGAEWRDVPLTELGSPSTSDFAGRIRASNTYATNRGFVGGFPNFEHADYGKGIVCGTILVKKTAAEWRDVPLAQVGGDLNDIPRRFGETHDYAKRNGFVSGFPNLFHADYGKGIVCGTVLIKPEFGVWRDLKIPTTCLK
jgi:hypothetical protein